MAGAAAVLFWGCYGAALALLWAGLGLLLGCPCAAPSNNPRPTQEQPQSSPRTTLEQRANLRSCQ